MSSKHWEQNRDATVYVGNVDERVTKELIIELMTQMGPVRQVHMPLDRISQNHSGFGFVEFDTPETAEYASTVLNGTRMCGKPIRVNKASADKAKALDIGAELFVNGLDPQVDEKILYDTFSKFGRIVRQPNVVRDENNVSKGYGFVNFDSFEASDAAREAMNGAQLFSRTITVEYSYKKDGRGERHGDEAERRLAAEGKKHNIVPQQQPLPPAFHMNGPAGGPGPAPGVVPPVVSPAGPHMGIPGPTGVPSPAVPVAAYGMGVTPPTGPSGRGGQVPPFGAPTGPGAGRMPASLPPAPSGLPARPPPSQPNFGGPPPGFHPVPGAPPAGFPPGPHVGPGPNYAGVPPTAGGFPVITPGSGLPMPPPSYMPPPGGFPPPGPFPLQGYGSVPPQLPPGPNPPSGPPGFVPR